GLKEKLLAAHRGGIKTVVIPIDNEKDLAEIPDNVKAGLTIIPVRTVDDALKITLTYQPKPIPFEELDNTGENKQFNPEKDDKTVTVM
ncbi:MAG: endopeptidase La, partial [Alphaproteobacteria bacterium]|nr:endopeptidase La [Alphaproteobacteria bacterium]